jgi:hypothetical protein
MRLYRIINGHADNGVNIDLLKQGNVHVRDVFTIWDYGIHDAGIQVNVLTAFLKSQA